MVLNFVRDPLQPFFGPLRASALKANRRFQFCDPVFRRAQLNRETMRSAEGLLCILLCNRRSFLK